MDQFVLFVISLLANLFSAFSGGGAGLVQLPALIFLGLPFGVALATHKVASVALGLGATLRHWKEGSLERLFVIYMLAAGLPGVVIGASLTLADIAIVTKIDLVSQAEREVFRANIMDVAQVVVVETDALHGINIDPLVSCIEKMQETSEPWVLRGNPPVATCTICAGKKDIGWEQHFGVVRTLDSDLFYRGQ